jgi:hypothetical protein
VASDLLTAGIAGGLALAGYGCQGTMASLVRIDAEGVRHVEHKEGDPFRLTWW